MIQKFKLDFTLSGNLGPIIVDIITKNKNKINVPVGTELATQAFHTHIIFSSTLSDIHNCKTFVSPIYIPRRCSAVNS